MLTVTVKCSRRHDRVGTGDRAETFTQTGVKEDLRKAVAFELNHGEHKKITKWKSSE